MCFEQHTAFLHTQHIPRELSDLAVADADGACSLSSELAAEQERIAFLAGLQLSAQLMLELNNE